MNIYTLLFSFSFFFLVSSCLGLISFQFAASWFIFSQNKITHTSSLSIFSLHFLSTFLLNITSQLSLSAFTLLSTFSIRSHLPSCPQWVRRPPPRPLRPHHHTLRQHTDGVHGADGSQWIISALTLDLTLVLALALAFIGDEICVCVCVCVKIDSFC